MADPLNTIVDAVRTTLERCPPELAADLVDRGIVLAGGGALLKGLDRLLRAQHLAIGVLAQAQDLVAAERAQQIDLPRQHATPGERQPGPQGTAICSFEGSNQGRAHLAPFRQGD